MSQASFFDPDEGDRRRDESIADAERGAPPEWLTAARDIATAFIEPWTTDDLWHTLHERGIPGPREPRALGPVVINLYRAGLIEPTGRMVRSQRPVAHRNPKREWRPTNRNLYDRPMVDTKPL
jgi:hypothetical protein